MKKILLTFLIMCITAGTVLASNQSALEFFHRYVSAANSYNPVITTMYSPNAKIIREVIRPNGQTVTRVTNTQRYIREMRKSQAIARIRGYKNYYSDISVHYIGNGYYKVSALRQPTGESYRLKAYFVVKQEGSDWQITEEMMQTKVQIFINAK